MTIMKNELRLGKKSLLIWSAVIAFMLGLCVLIYPQMAGQMNEISGLFADMGGFSAAFGMDQINFGEFLGYFSVECGNVLGLGGAFFAALLGITALAKEERDHTAEFLLTHPVSRSRVVWQKLCAVLIQIVILNAVVFLTAMVTTAVIGEKPDGKTLSLLLLAYLILQVEIASVCFGISAWISRGGAGIGLGIAVLAYFFNIISNLTEEARFLKYITPFGYTEGADIINSGCIDVGYLTVGLILTVLGIGAAFYRYNQKDIT